jgi:hypothetical protein
MRFPSVNPLGNASVSVIYPPNSTLIPAFAFMLALTAVIEALLLTNN